MGEKFLYKSIRYRIDMKQQAQAELDLKLKAWAELGWEPFQISCFEPHWALVVYRKKAKD